MCVCVCVCGGVSESPCALQKETKHPHITKKKNGLEEAVMVAIQRGDAGYVFTLAWQKKTPLTRCSYCSRCDRLRRCSWPVRNTLRCNRKRTLLCEVNGHRPHYYPLQCLIPVLAGDRNKQKQKSEKKLITAESLTFCLNYLHSSSENKGHLL
jgi:hypothetical protein